MNKDFPKISIIMPVFNGELFLEEAIKSVINQNYPNLEFIIIDGGSNDNSLNIINAYKNKVDILITEKDYGLNHAVNKGIMLASGEYINWLNADDYYYENSLLKVGDFLSKNTQIDLLYGDAAHVDINGNFLTWHGAIPFDKNHLIHKRNYIPCQAAFFKKSCLSYIGLLDNNLKWCGDWDMWKRFANLKEFKIVFLDEKLAAWRLHNDTITSGGGSSKQMYLCALENIKSTRKYSNKMITTLEIKNFVFLLVGLLGLRKILRKIRNTIIIKNV
jgi:glycosyltransferase involved in cell wall biosynthesis